MELDFRKDPSILTSIVDAMAPGVFTVNGKGQFVAWSEGAERITGYASSDVIGKPCDILEGANTNKDLRKLVADGTIREDFFYRIHVFEIRLPPLRERKADIPLLVDYFIHELCRSKGRSVDGIARDALQLMMDYHWPGNVRQLTLWKKIGRYAIEVPT